MKNLADIVADAGLLTEARLAAAGRRAVATGEPLIVVLAETERLKEETLALALGRHLGRPPVDIVEIDEEALREVPYDLARARRLVPLAVVIPNEGPRVLRVAMADPTDAETVRELEAASGCRVEPVLARLSVVDAALRRAYRGLVTAVMKPEETPRRVPFGGDLVTQTSDGRLPALHTQPFHRLDDEAPLEVRHRALIELLISKGLISQEEYLRELRRLLPEHD